MKANLTRKIHKIGFVLKKHSPEILMVVGVIGTVTGAVMACKATTKLEETLEPHKENLKAIRDAKNDPDLAEEYPVEDQRKDTAIEYAKISYDVVKLYAPAVIVGAVGLTSMLAANNILRKRNVALTAAYATLDKAYKDYRARVVERFGEEMDKELKYNLKAKEVKQKVVDEETGKEKTEKIVMYGMNPEDISEYARFFDDSNPNWEGAHEYNLMFLKRNQSYANDMLRAKGFLFLNDVYKMLGIKETKAGQIVGWVYDPENGKGDNYIDFGIHRFVQNFDDFINGDEDYILLDFNVDGNIWELMK